MKQARTILEHLRKSPEQPSVSEEDIEKAKHAISTALANSSLAEQELHEQYQKEFKSLDIE